tara:strand:+ start:47 stop:307 length:261 start_codon:yes stop_codon:yes gene_type:complete
MKTKDLNPIINIGTCKDPLMVLCAFTMIKMYQKSTGKKFGKATMNDYQRYVDGYCDAYNANFQNKYAPFLPNKPYWWGKILLDKVS